ncbi:MULTISPECIES: ATP-binding protein [unclassified Streptomyces]|uniref:ATP-binding protein n=1 Tax=unclassified Streptomyces TaxID=2593676 RepID=UPI0004C8184C|nr:ATP-binding protein [Streptomyces sp. NRRL F-5135]
MIGLIDTEGGASAEWTFPAVLDTAHDARHAVHDALDAWGLPPALREMAILLVSELVTNSLRYATGPIGVRLAVRPGTPGPSAAGRAGPGPDGSGPDGSAPAGAGRDGGGAPGGSQGAQCGTGSAVEGEGAALLVEISDALPDPPAARRVGPDDEGGRGLQLVACSSRRWGTRRGKTGKTVWFELPLPG